MKTFPICMLLVGSMVCMLLTNCSYEDRQPEGLSPWVGTWERECETSNSTLSTNIDREIYEVHSYSFNENTYSSLSRFYLEEDCNEKTLALEIEYGESFRVGKEAQEKSGISDIDFEIGEISGYMLTRDAIANANNNDFCGGGWKQTHLDRSVVNRKSLSDLSCLFPNSNVSSGMAIYTTFKIEGDVLSVGQSSDNNQGTSAFNRVMLTNSDKKYRRR